jgi:hypothetical protein
MTKRLLMYFAAVTCSLLLVSTASAQFAKTGTTNISVGVAAEAAISVTSATTLSTTGTIFNDYTGTTSFQYKVRTTKTGGSGSVTMKVTTDFSTGGTAPSVANPPTSGDTLSFTSALTGVGSGVGTATPVTTTTDTTMATFGTNARSTKAGDSGTVSWTLTNDPLYETGSYSAVVTFTIAAV